MAVVGSTITIDMHLTEDADLESVRGAVRQNGRVQADLAGRVQRTIEEKAAEALEGRSLGDYTLSTEVELVDDRVPGAPRERLTVALDFEGDDPVIAAVDDAVTPPDRAKVADAVERIVVDYLAEYDLSGAVDVIVSVTPIEFR